MEQFEITINTIINAPVDRVWHLYTDTESIKLWNTASPEWHTTQVHQKLEAGGMFTYCMEAIDGSEGFDFTGVFDIIIPEECIEYTLADGRKVVVDFLDQGDNTLIEITFEPENENPVELQQQGWQAILDNFTRFAEKNS